VPDPQRAVSGLDILGQHLHAANQIVAAGRKRLAQYFRIGEEEIRRRQRVGDLLNVEFGLLAGVRIDALGILHEFLRPLRRQEIELHHEIEKLIRFPLGVTEALVARRWRDRRWRFFAGETAHRRAPQIEIGLGDFLLQLRRAVLVRQPVLGDRGEGLDHLGELARRLVFDFAALARLEIGCERLAARLHGPREVDRKGFRVELFRNLGLGRNVTHAATL
jgi:hypothetical protein